MTPLYQITALARSGALERAWALFDAGGYAAADSDPSALAVKGRLLKDKALRAAGDARTQLLREAGAAYAAADALAPQPWLLINVATLAALGGDNARAADLAGKVLARLDDGSVAETPYFIAATRAEAHLLRGDIAAADAALGQAVAADPDNWTDRATTLRQLGLLLSAQGADARWLDAHRPPCSLHFAGHLGVSEGGAEGLRAEVDAWLSTASVGFGYGSLAAGSDLVIAEALLAQGAELHVILPTRREYFLVQSVIPYGQGWVARFDVCLAQAASVREATSVAGPYEPLATALAARTAMGAAILNARLLESHAVQLLVADEGEGPFGSGASTSADGAAWQETRLAQFVIRRPRDAPVAPSLGKREGRPDRKLMALVHILIDGLYTSDDEAFANALDAGAVPFWTRASALGCQPQINVPHGNARLLAFDDLTAAAAFAREAHALAAQTHVGLSISGHYGLVHELNGSVIGPAITALRGIAAATAPGTTVVSEPFATVLALCGDDHTAVDLGDHGDARLFALQ